MSRNSKLGESQTANGRPAAAGLLRSAHRQFSPPARLQLALLDPQVARELGFEGVVAKNHSSLYRPNDRGWVKIKNPNYWRRDAEREAMTRRHERRVRTRA
jgi:hypothetical protein